MINLTDAEIFDLCNHLVNEAASYSLQIAPILQCMANTGLRVNECYELERWSFPDPDHALVQLEKNSGQRLIEIDYIPADFHHMAITYPTSNFHFSVRQLNYFIRANSGYTRLMVGNKDVKCHLFRYNYCRVKFNNGETITAIKDDIVHSSLTVTSGYIFNPIKAFE